MADGTCFRFIYIMDNDFVYAERHFVLFLLGDLFGILQFLLNVFLCQFQFFDMLLIEFLNLDLNMYIRSGWFAVLIKKGELNSFRFGTI